MAFAGGYRVPEGHAVEVAGRGGRGNPASHGAQCARSRRMIIVDTALKAREAEGKPIRVGMLGAGFMGQGLANQIVNSVPGMRMAAVSNRRPERAVGVYHYAGVEDVAICSSQASLDEAIRRGRGAVAEDPFMICRSPEIDIIVDVTGSVEFGAHAIL